MPILPRNLLRSFFERGDKPTEGQFMALIDSMLHKSEDSSLLGLREYDITKSYLVGDAVVYNEFIFQATENTSGTFDPGAWKKLLSIGALSYKGTWNASTNTPHLTSSVGTNGDYYVVSVGGTTTLNGISTWNTGDHVLFNGSVWERVTNASFANLVAYDNSTSGLAATQVQAAIDEVEARVDAAETSLSSLSTSNVTEGSNLYYTNARFDSSFAGKTTDDLTEGASNLYFSTARFTSTLNTKTTDDLAEGAINRYYTPTNFNASFSAKTTDDLAEGSTNLYFSNERVDDRVSQLLTAVNGLQFVYYDSSNLLEIKMPDGLGGGTMRYTGAEWVNSSLLFNNEIKIGINTNGTGESLFGITGRGSTSENQAISVKNSSDNGLLEVWDDGLVTIGYTAHTGTSSRVVIRNTNTWSFSNAAEIYQTRTATGNALSITSDGIHGGTNTGIKLNVTGAVTNYAIHADQGDVYINGGNIGIGYTPVSTSKLYIRDTSVGIGLQIEQLRNSGSSAAAVFGASGSGTINKAGVFAASGASSINYAIEATYGDVWINAGSVGIGNGPSSSTKLHVVSNLIYTGLFEGGRTDGTCIALRGYAYNTNSGDNIAASFTAINGANNYAIYIDGGDFYQSSDRFALAAPLNDSIRMHIKGMSDTGGTYSLSVINTSEIESFSVKDDGEVYAARIKTDMIAGGEAPTWKLGAVRSGAGLSLDASNYIEVEINGERYKLALARP